MAQVRGDAGELVQRLIDLIKGLPEHDAINVCAFIAYAIGGRALTKWPRRADEIPELGTIGAELFIDGSTLELDPYLELLSARLNEIVAGGIREDFLIRSVGGEVSRRLTRLADVEAGNVARAEMLRMMEEAGVELTQSLRDLIGPHTEAERNELVADLDRWDTAREERLPASDLDDWTRRSSFGGP